MKKLISLTILFFGLNSILLFGQYEELCIQIGYQKFGLNIEDVIKEYSDEIDLNGNTLNLGVDYSFPIVVMKSKERQLINGSAGLHFGRFKQNSLSYTKMIVPFEIKFIFGEKYIFECGAGIDLSGVLGNDSFDEFNSFVLTNRSIQFSYSGKLGVKFTLKNGHGIGLTAVYRRSLNPLYSNAFETVKGGTYASNNMIEISTGVLVRYSIPIVDLVRSRTD